MNTQEFTQWLHKVADGILDGSTSVALVSIENETASIAAAGDDAVDAMAQLLVVAAAHQEALTIPEGVRVN